MQENRIRKAHSSEAPFHRERCTAHYDMDSTHAARANMRERAMRMLSASHVLAVLKCNVSSGKSKQWRTEESFLNHSRTRTHLCDVASEANRTRGLQG